jgi:hypothetical protein
VLLVFRQGSQNVEFDLGSVTNFLGKTNGYTTTVTGWDLSLVTSTFGSLTGVKSRSAGHRRSNQLVEQCRTQYHRLQYQRVGCGHSAWRHQRHRHEAEISDSHTHEPEPIRIPLTPAASMPGHPMTTPFPAATSAG